MSGEKQSAANRFLYVLGVLIMAGSGLCTGGGFLMGVRGFMSNSREGRALGSTIILMAAVIGGVPFLIGWLLYRFNRKAGGDPNR